jgi:hypothetical protein
LTPLKQLGCHECANQLQFKSFPLNSGALI